MIFFVKNVMKDVYIHEEVANICITKRRKKVAMR